MRGSLGVAMKSSLCPVNPMSLLVCVQPELTAALLCPMHPGLVANRPALQFPVHCYAHIACSASLINVQPNTQPNALLNTQPFIAEEIGIPS